MRMTPGIARIAAEMTSANKELARALPDAKGGETQKQLQTYRTEVFDYFTEPGGTKLLYSAENWVRIKLTLQTAGPVTVGTRATLEPILSGKGRLLDTDVEWQVFLARGSRIFIASGAVNRVSVTVEPVPWLEQISGEITSLATVFLRGAGSIVQGTARALRGEPVEPIATSASQTPTLRAPAPSRALATLSAAVRRGR